MPEPEITPASLREWIRWWAREKADRPDLSGWALPNEREHVDRPEWAYDEDGYCVACGNGKWKAHNTWCEIAYLIDLATDADDPLYGSADG